MLPNCPLFFPARICSADKIKLISVQRNDSMQYSNSGVVLGWNWDGVANDAKGVNVRVANKNNRGLYAVFEVEYLWSGWVKKDGVNANLVLCDSPNFRYSHWFYLYSSFKFVWWLYFCNVCRFFIVRTLQSDSGAGATFWTHTHSDALLKNKTLIVR